MENSVAIHVAHAECEALIQGHLSLFHATFVSTAHFCLSLEVTQANRHQVHGTSTPGSLCDFGQCLDAFQGRVGGNAASRSAFSP
jgi:hypothetical protein